MHTIADDRPYSGLMFAARMIGKSRFDFFIELSNVSARIK
jgi:hypothetical protein